MTAAFWTSLRVVVFVILCAGFAAVPVRAQTPLAEAIELMEADDWPGAALRVATIPEPSARIYFEWRRLRAGKGAFGDYLIFMENHADWPGLPLLMKQGEPSIPARHSPNEVVAFFAHHLPQTGIGALRLAEALDALGRPDDAKASLSLAWRTLPMSASDQAALLGRYGADLASEHWARLDGMIWEGHMASAEAMLPLVSAGQAKLAAARIALRRNKDGVTKLIEAIPATLMEDPGLAYDRFVWRARRDLDDGAREIAAARSVSRAKLGRPEAWSKRRASLARGAMRTGKPKTAYRLARDHRLMPEEKGFTDLEWLAGFIALRKLNDPEAAIDHFRALRVVAKTPITSGRVWYWLGRAHEAAGNAEKAAEAYGVGARYQTSFYGQLAAERGGFDADPTLAGTGQPGWQGAAFMKSTVFEAGMLLHLAEQRYSAGRFFAHQAETMTEAEQAQLGAFLLDLERPNMALRVAKNAAKQGRVIAAPYYPLHPVSLRAKSVPPELALAIVRQESEFNPDVESPVGALGLMQVMPATAKAVARGEGWAYSRERLVGDWAYNADIGVAYLSQVVAQHSGSYVLAAASYNAGPRRAKQWMERYGDPRKAGVDAVDWIEHIPFTETRNYVMRVTEALHVYRARLSGKAQPLRLSKDLARGG